MARGKSVELDSIKFRTRTEALSYFKEMLSRYSPEDVVSDADGAILRSLIARHPEAAEKRGPGIHHFEVMSAEFGTKCFAIVRNNGTRIDFSYPICVNTDPVN